MAATELWLVRHGESVANVAAAQAEAAGSENIVVEYRDADVPLSDLGRQQASALGTWLAANQGSSAPSAVWASSYLRARQTVDIALDEAHIPIPVRVDDRLRDRELGVLDLLTGAGVLARYPEEASRREWLGRFYYRPPGGESWADVALRIRSFLASDEVREEDGCILVATHDAVVMLFLYVCAELSEDELLRFAASNVVTNASVTRLVRPTGTGRWSITNFAMDEHLRESATPVTEHPGEHSVTID